MANTISFFGLRAIGRVDGGSPTAGMTRTFILSTDANPVFTGDLVANSTAGNYITWYSTNIGTARGVFVGCEFFSNGANRTVWSPYWPGSAGSTADVVAYVIDDPQQLFLAQTSSQAVMGSSMVGLNIAVTPSSQGNTTTGISNLALQSSNIATASSYPFRVWDVWSNWAPPGTNGTDLTTAGSYVVVAPNQFSRTVATARSS